MIILTYDMTLGTKPKLVVAYCLHFDGFSACLAAQTEDSKYSRYGYGLDWLAVGRNRELDCIDMQPLPPGLEGT
jgi:hypothetical protein